MIKTKFLAISLIIITLSTFLSCKNKKNEVSNKNKQSDPIALVSEEIKKDENNPDLYNKRAKLYLLSNQTNTALNDINKAILLDKDKPDFYLTLSDIYFATIQIEKSKEAINKALSLNSNNPDAYLKLAELNLYLKQYDETQKNADKAIEIEKNTSQAYFIKGYAYKENGDSTKAVTQFLKTIEVNPDHFEAYMQLGLMFSNRNNKIAIDYLNSALNLNPKSIEANYALGMFLQENGKQDEAIKAYKNIISINPSYREAYYNIGYIYLEYKKDFKEALNYFGDAIKTDNEYAEAFYNRGYTYELLKDYKNARNDYKKAIDLKHNYQKAIEAMNRLDKLNN